MPKCVHKAGMLADTKPAKCAIAIVGGARQGTRNWIAPVAPLPSVAHRTDDLSAAFSVMRKQPRQLDQHAPRRDRDHFDDLPIADRHQLIDHVHGDTDMVGDHAHDFANNRFVIAL